MAAFCATKTHLFSFGSHCTLFTIDNSVGDFSHTSTFVRRNRTDGVSTDVGAPSIVPTGDKLIYCFEPRTIGSDWNGATVHKIENHCKFDGYFERAFRTRIVYLRLHGISNWTRRMKKNRWNAVLCIKRGKNCVFVRISAPKMRAWKSTNQTCAGAIKISHYFLKAYEIHNRVCVWVLIVFERLFNAYKTIDVNKIKIFTVYSDYVFRRTCVKSELARVSF